MPAAHRGTYLGLIDRLPDITHLGATTVVLGPVCVCAPGTGAWGRNPTHFLAPDPKYAAHGPANAANELKMVGAWGLQLLVQCGHRCLLL